jgi:uncharacterized cupredoxin-like copper-binding protein
LKGALIGSIVAIAAIGIVAVLVVLPAMQPPIAEFELTMVDYGFNKPGFGPTLTVKVGQVVRVKLENKGSHSHEFMIMPDKDRALMMAKRLVNEILEKGLPEEEALETYEHESHEMMDRMMEMVDFMEPPVDVTLEPDESKVIEFVFTKPGTYWYVCQEAGGTWPEIHQEKGMFGKIIVEPAG